MKRIVKRLLAVCLAVGLGVSAVGPVSAGHEPGWRFGFGCARIDPPGDQPLYIAGYHSGWRVSDVLDACEARAAWLDAGEGGVLLIGVDCIALASGTVEWIRSGLSDLENCISVNVYATHTHAGPDTLGLWGPVCVDGKNDDYMNALVAAAVQAGRQAAENIRPGTLYFGQTQTSDMLYDSRLPKVYDEALCQLRFEPEDGSAGLRMLFYGAHAESLRGANTRLSRDFPGGLCDRVTEATGDDAMFLPGAVGGLIMTREFVADISQRAEQNLTRTAERLTGYVLGISADSERSLEPRMAFSRHEITIPLDNPAFLTYKLLGILETKAVPADSSTGYGVSTELSVLMLGDLAIGLIPGEIFPELVYGGEYGHANPDGENPRPLCEIAADYGVEKLLIVGLANDEIGYIVPPSDFLVHDELPYLERIRDNKGEDHYEETNSVGPACAGKIAEAFEQALEALR